MKTILKKILRTIKRSIVYVIRSTGALIKGLYCILITFMRGDRFKPESHINEDIVLLGNGPSLNELDLERIATKHNIACVNWFATKNFETFFKIKPKYYFLAAPNFFNDRHKLERDKLIQLFNNVVWDMTLIIPQSCNFPVENNHINIQHIVQSAICSDYLKKFTYYLHKYHIATCGIQNVLCGAIYYFLANKFHIVYVSGADMSEFRYFHIDERNHVLCQSPHFYDTNNTDYTEAGYIPLGDFYKWLGYYAKMLKEFHYLREFANEQNTTVINLTLNSFIDSFEKIDWKKIV